MNIMEQLTGNRSGRSRSIMEALARINQSFAIMESALSFDDTIVDPREAFYDQTTGEMWDPVGGDRSTATNLRTEETLAAVRRECRQLAMHNPFAINGHENRINYLVGSGHVYTAVPIHGTALAREIDSQEKSNRQQRKDGEDVAAVEDPLRPPQRWIDEFLTRNKWGARQQEIIRRKDRDGECFLRIFADKEDGMPLIRFVEPGEVATPLELVSNPDARWGILTEPGDVETVLGYFLGGENEPVPAAEIQHRKQGVDFNVKRGLPLYFSVRKNLRRAEKLLRNMSTVAEIQAAIAMIRKHNQGIQANINSMVQGNADVSVLNQRTGKTSYHKQYAPGTIIDASDQIEYEFPTQGIDAGNYVQVLQAELRSISSRLVMPEFMLTSDASNANYASTMVAEGPAVKMFARLQCNMIEEDAEIMERVLDAGVEAGRFPAELREQIEVDAKAPQLAARNRKDEVDADTVLVREKIMSKRTARVRQDLDPDEEEELIESEKGPDPFGGMALDGLPFGGQPKNPNEQGEEDDE